MKLIRILANIWNHPLNREQRTVALMRFFKWQLLSRLAREPLVIPFVDKSVLVVERGMMGATGNIYNGLHEHADMLFALHFLRSSDLFVDVGANIGSYTILASANRGARVVSFEPVPATFAHLRRNVLANDVMDKVELVNKAVASEAKEIQFTTNLDAGNHALPDSGAKSGIMIECTTLDYALHDAPGLLKIDVEGFETEVISGARRVLTQSELKAIIIELNGSGARYGFNEEEIHQTLVGYGFTPYSYDPFMRQLTPLGHWGTHNSIYIRDFNFVHDRIQTSPFVHINNLDL